MAKKVKSPKPPKASSKTNGKKNPSAKKVLRDTYGKGK